MAAGTTASLILEIIGMAAPVVQGVIQSIQQRTAADGSIEYTVVINAGKADIQNAAMSFQNALGEINKQRELAGLPALDIPPIEGGG